MTWAALPTTKGTRRHLANCQHVIVVESDTTTASSKGLSVFEQAKLLFSFSLV
jgi:hypothetical protein